MRITKRQLKRIIREEYSKIKRQQRLSESRRRRRLHENAAPPAIQAVQMAMDGASQGSIQSALEGMGLSPADAMAEAARKFDIGVCWGAAWATPSDPYPMDISKWDGSMEDAMNAYVDLRRSQGRRPFIDEPHFELII